MAAMAPCSHFFFFYRYAAHRDLHSFPTRRSSDLRRHGQVCRRDDVAHRVEVAARRLRRSEEHTSELQSQFQFVCRLLLEKKNTSTRWTQPIESSRRIVCSAPSQIGRASV